MYDLLTQKNNSSLWSETVHYFNSVLETWQSVIQLILIALCCGLFLWFLLAIIFNPKRKEKRQAKNIHNLHAKIVALKKDISDLDEKCAVIDADIVAAENDAGKKIDMLYACDKNVKSQGVSDEKRADVLAKLIADTERDLTEFKHKKESEKDILTAKRNAKESELNTLLDKSNKRNKSKDPDMRRYEDLTEGLKRRRNLQESEIKALEELRIAKEEYELACKKRQQAEQNRLTAIANAKSEAEEKRKLDELIKKSEKSQETPPPQQDIPTIEQEHNEVQLIISDMNGNGISTITEQPLREEEPAETNPVENNKQEQENAVKSDSVNDFVQLSLDDDFREEVVFTHVDAEDGTVISEEIAPQAFNENNDNPVDELTISDTSKNKPSDHQTYIEGFSPDEPSSLWKIVRCDDEFTAYLIANGRKIAHTEKQPTVPLAKVAISEVRKCMKKKYGNVIPDNIDYTFIVKNKTGKIVLSGEKRFTEESAQKDLSLATELCKSDIRVII